MIGKEVLGKRPLTVPEVGELLSSVQGEETYEQKVTREYVQKVAKSDAKTAREKVKALVEAGLPEELAIKIVNIWPKDKTDVHVLLAKEEGVSADLYDKILEILGS